MARRFAVVACALASLVPLAVLLPAGAAANSSSSSQQSAARAIDLGVLQQVNESRAAHHLAPLSLCPNLSAAALQHSREMVATGYFAHNSANGEPFWKRIMSFYPEPRYGFWSVGENLYWTAGPATAGAGMEAWMASPPHRRNILDPRWRQIGIATVSSPDAPGAYRDLGVTVITTDFGVRA